MIEMVEMIEMKEMIEMRDDRDDRGDREGKEETSIKLTYSVSIAGKSRKNHPQIFI